jgi:hypothetical protein
MYVYVYIYIYIYTHTHAHTHTSNIYNWCLILARGRSGTGLRRRLRRGTGLRRRLGCKHLRRIVDHKPLQEVQCPSNISVTHHRGREQILRNQAYLRPRAEWAPGLGMPGGPPSIFPLPPGSISFLPPAQSVQFHIKLVFDHLHS